MIAEQTFCWLGRFKKILNSVGKNHFHFMLHRIVKKRNEYTEYCHLVGKYPLLPSAKLSKINKWLLFFIIASLLNNVIKNWIWLHCIVFLFKTSVNISSVSSKLSFFSVSSGYKLKLWLELLSTLHFIPSRDNMLKLACLFYKFFDIYKGIYVKLF